MFGWFTDRAAATKAHRWEELIPPGATQVDLHKRRLGPAGGTAVAEALRNNTTLTLLDLSTNHLGEEGGKAIAEALRHNTTLTALDLNANRLGEAGGKAMADALRHSTGQICGNTGGYPPSFSILGKMLK
ncbi:NLR family CARD domain-containing protein 3 [Balamuthia mandrillaris]